MPTIEIEGFGGIIPRTGPARLGADAATIARNIKLQSGEMRPWQNPLNVYAPKTADCLGIYKLVNPTTGAFVWMESATDWDVVGSPMADSTDGRVYYTGNATPRKTNWALATGGGVAPYPNAYYEMGVPGPTAAPTLAPSSTTAPAEVRAYVYTFVNVFGAVQEESAPSPASTVTVSSSSASVTLSGFSAPPAGHYNYQFINIYRTVVGSAAGVVSFQFVGQVPIGTTSVADILTVTQLGQTLPSTFYTPPPAGLTGLVEMPNGMLAGFVGNQVWFCEPFHPHAWPVTYMQTVEYPVVGLGVFGNSLFVGTQKNPYLITGTTPSAVSIEKLPIIQACVSKRSIVSDQWGVVYASPNGLLAVGPGVQDIVTQSLFTRDEWQAINPSTLIGVLYNNMYIGFHSNGAAPTSAFVFSRADTPALTTYDFEGNCVFVERSTGSVYAVNQFDNGIYRFDGDPTSTTVFQWQSRMYIMPVPTNFGAIKVSADWSQVLDPVAYANIIAAIQASNAAIWNANIGKTLGGSFNDTPANVYTVDGSIIAALPPASATSFVTAFLYGDGEQIWTAGLQSDRISRLPAGIKCSNYQILITGNVAVRKIALGTTVGELNRV
jgi:hypothetical protein